ncbi:hypothetical protein ACWDAO_13145 [Streptomyces sp. NPDC001212]
MPPFPAQEFREAGAAASVSSDDPWSKAFGKRDLPVRAMVLRRDDERVQALRAAGAEAVVGDVTCAGDVVDALDGCGRCTSAWACQRSIWRLP